MKTTLLLLVLISSSLAHGLERECFSIWEPTHESCDSTPNRGAQIGSIEIRRSNMQTVPGALPGKSSLGDIDITINFKKTLRLFDHFWFTSEPGHGTWYDNYAVTGTSGQAKPADTNVAFEGSDVGSYVTIRPENLPALQYCTRRRPCDQ